MIAGALYMAASAGGLILSATVGFIGIHDGLGVPWATTSLVVELVGLVIVAGTLAARAPAASRRGLGLPLPSLWWCCAASAACRAQLRVAVSVD